MGNVKRIKLDGGHLMMIFFSVEKYVTVTPYNVIISAIN